MSACAARRGKSGTTAGSAMSANDAKYRWNSEVVRVIILVAALILD